MTNDKRPVVCSHCATRLTIPADSTRKQFKCVKCGERTTIQLGVALAKNTTTDDFEMGAPAEELERLDMASAPSGLIHPAGKPQDLIAASTASINGAGSFSTAQAPARCSSARCRSAFQV